MMKPRMALVAVALAATLLPTAGIGQSTGHATGAAAKDAVAQVSRKDKAVAALRTFRGGDRLALKWIHPNYIEHDLSVDDGLRGLKAHVRRASGVERLQIHRVFQDSNYVVLHSSDTKNASFDVFLFDGGLIAEHWQNAQSLGAPNASGRIMVEGTTEIKGKGTTNLETNKRILAKVAQVFANGGPAGDLKELYVENFVQHASYMGDGLTPLLAFLGPQASGATSESVTHLRLAEGDFVFTASEDHTDGKLTAYFDLFRIENGRIAEHWDTVSEIPQRSAWRNNNGKF